MPLNERNASFSKKSSAKAGLAITQRALALWPKAIKATLCRAFDDWLI